jgi:hypothetical protein
MGRRLQLIGSFTPAPRVSTKCDPNIRDGHGYHMRCCKSVDVSREQQAGARPLLSARGAVLSSVRLVSDGARAALMGRLWSLGGGSDGQTDRAFGSHSVSHMWE